MRSSAAAAVVVVVVVMVVVVVLCLGQTVLLWYVCVLWCVLLSALVGWWVMSKRL